MKLFIDRFSNLVKATNFIRPIKVRFGNIVYSAMNQCFLLDLGEEYFIYFYPFVKRDFFIVKIHETVMEVFRANVIK